MKLMLTVVLALTLSIVALVVGFILLVVGALSVDTWQVQADEATVQRIIAQGLPVGSGVPRAVAFLNAHPTITLPNRRFDGFTADTHFVRVPAYDENNCEPQVYPRGRSLCIFSTANDGAELTVVLFFDGKGRFARASVQEITIHMP